MPNNRGITGQRWYECDICGFDYPACETMERAGLRICLAMCVDEGPFIMAPVTPGLGVIEIGSPDAMALVSFGYWDEPGEDELANETVSQGMWDEDEDD